MFFGKPQLLRNMVKNTAKQVGAAHEINPFAINSKATTKFSGPNALFDADETIDLLNNKIGRKIGNANPTAGMKDLALQTLKYFHEKGLYVATYKTEVKDGKEVVITAEVIQRKLTAEEYKEALETFNQSNENGYTPEQQKERDKELKEEAELRKIAEQGQNKANSMHCNKM